tara:strand:+ start:244 stop:351 length:108 start_codon:yes stop_codon:yes gene_type:complete
VKRKQIIGEMKMKYANETKEEIGWKEMIDEGVVEE